MPVLVMNAELPIEIIIFLALVFSIVLYIDLKKQRIPNRITLPLAVSGILYHVFSSGLSGGLFFSLKGLLAGLGFFFIPFLLQGAGGGDVKFSGALGCWIGAFGVLNLLLYGAAAGGVIALAILLKKKDFSSLKNLYYDINYFIFTKNEPEPYTEKKKKNGFPYSIPLAAGFVIYLICGPI